MRIVSVNVGGRAPIGERNGNVVRSAIRKSPVEGSTVDVGELGLAGDVQADLRVHGGPLMAIHVHPVEHLQAWAAELGRPVPPGSIGDNLTVEGVLEAEVRVGDRYRWGDVRVRVTKPRTPCFKLDLVLGAAVGPTVWRLHRTGWYFAVERPGTAPTSGSLQLIEQGVGSTIAALVAAKAPVELRQRRAR